MQSEHESPHLHTVEVSVVEAAPEDRQTILARRSAADRALAYAREP